MPEIGTMIIGIAGNAGSGKSSASKLLSEITKFPIIEMDQIVTDLYEDRLILEEIGNALSITDRPISRPLISQVILENSLLLSKIEVILFPKMLNRFLELAASLENLILDCAILNKEPFKALADQVLIISAHESIKIIRLQKRQPNIPNYAQNILKLQKRIFSFTQNTYIIENNGSENELLNELKNY